MIQDASFGFIDGIESSLWQRRDAQVDVLVRQDLGVVILAVLPLDDSRGGGLIDGQRGSGLVAREGREGVVGSCHFFLCTTNEESRAERGCRMRLLIEQERNAVGCEGSGESPKVYKGLRVGEEYARQDTFWMRRVYRRYSV